MSTALVVRDVRKPSWFVSLIVLLATRTQPKGRPS